MLDISKFIGNKVGVVLNQESQSGSIWGGFLDAGHKLHFLIVIESGSLQGNIFKFDIDQIKIKFGIAGLPT